MISHSSVLTHCSVKQVLYKNAQNENALFQRILFRKYLNMRKRTFTIELALPTVDNLIVLAALLHVRIDDILVTDNAVA